MQMPTKTSGIIAYNTRIKQKVGAMMKKRKLVAAMCSYLLCLYLMLARSALGISAYSANLPLSSQWALTVGAIAAEAIAFRRFIRHAGQR